MCVRSEEEKKRILNSCHGGAAGGHFGSDKTLQKICFIGETWLRRDSRICEGVPTVSKDECQFYHEASSIPVQPKVWCQVNIYVLFPNKCVRIFCIGVLLTIVYF